MGPAKHPENEHPTGTRERTPVTTPAAASRAVRCPACGGDSVYGPENPWRPFCSERCKSLDFGAWASEAYRVQAKPEPPDDDPRQTS